MVCAKLMNTESLTVNAVTHVSLLNGVTSNSLENAYIQPFLAIIGELCEKQLSRCSHRNTVNHLECENGGRCRNGENGGKCNCPGK